MSVRDPPPRRGDGTGGAPSSPALVSSSARSSAAPGDLRRLAYVTVSGEYSVGGYVSSAMGLLERAHDYDAQGQLENAFVAYTKVASVLAQLPRHPQWAQEQAAHSRDWHRVHHLFKQTNTIITRAAQIEERLTVLATQSQSSAPASSSGSEAEDATLAAQMQALPSPTPTRPVSMPLSAPSLPLAPRQGLSASSRSSLSPSYRPLPKPPVQPSPPPPPPIPSPSSQSRNSVLASGPSIPPALKVHPPAPSKPPPAPPQRARLTVGELQHVLNSQSSVLLLDIRPGEAFAKGHIAHRFVVPINSDNLRSGTSLKELEDIVLSASLEEQEAFAALRTFDLVVLYDQGGSSSAADIVVRTLEAESLPHSPARLAGGFDAWRYTVGESGISRPPSLRPPTSVPPIKAPITHPPRAASLSERSSPVPSLSSVNVTPPARAYRPGAPRTSAYVPQSLIPSTQRWDYPQPLRAGFTPGQLIPPVQSPLSVPPSAAVPGRPLDGPQPFNGSYFPPVHPHPTRPLRSSSVPVPAPHPPKPRSVQRVGLTGLKNLGNTCYMNAVLQCLSATTDLSQLFLRGEFRRGVNRSNPLGTNGRLAEAYAHLVQVLWSEQYSFVAPISFRQVVEQTLPAFAGWEQHDCHEFLSFFADLLHEDLNHPAHRVAAKLTDEELERVPIQEAAAREWARYQETNRSFILQAFAGMLRNRLTCSRCSTTSTTYNVFRDLSLPVARRHRTASQPSKTASIYDALEAFLAVETLDGEDRWMCPKCKVARRAGKQLTLARLPPHLVIHLKRFSFQQRSFSLSPRNWVGSKEGKVMARVDIPLDGLDLSQYAPDGGVYDLYAVVHHFGSLIGGHYTATIRSGSGWVYLDDARIVPNYPKELYTNSPYVLWYKRRPQ